MGLKKKVPASFGPAGFLPSSFSSLDTNRVYAIVAVERAPEVRHKTWT
jgi:hypothetical protein